MLAVTGSDQLELGQRLLAIPFKRCAKPIIGFMSREEVAAVLAACDNSTWSSQRDRALFTLMYNTGARVSAITQLRLADAEGQVVRLHGKGRKERQIPLWPQTASSFNNGAGAISSSAISRFSAIAAALP